MLNGPAGTINRCRLTNQAESRAPYRRAQLCSAMQAGDVNAVNAHLLYISTNHWEEAAYWFPALKRLTKL